ncbi:MAG: DUF4153 domain-containing protein [Candidatus Latescibacterota bacterium]|jgi:hypothetical protein
MMSFPSTAIALTGAKRTALRFPLALACGVTAAVAAMILIDYRGDSSPLERLLMASQLGIPLFIAVTLLAERRGAGNSPFVKWVHQFAALGLLVAYYFSLPAEVGYVAVARLVQLNVGLHLLVAFAPYIRTEDENGFWQYNNSLFLRLLAALVFSATLFAGLSIAVLALDQLFGANIGDDFYPRLWIGVICVFNTWYFLGGVPSDLAELSRRRDYPPILKIFSQYILAPLVAIYLVILLVYFAKVVVTTEWPSGWIGYLVSSVAAAGLFSLVLLHPLVGLPENRWVNRYARLFYLFLLPAIAMLLLAIFKRISQYGITENRYYLLVLTFWLAFITAYGLLSRKKSIKIIPMTLCFVALVTSVGPWGAYGVSRSSQKSRLEGLLLANGLLVDNTLVPTAADVSSGDLKEISAALDYLVDRHGVGTVSPWFDPELAARINAIPGYGPRNERQHWEISQAIMRYLEEDYVPAYGRSSSTAYYFRRELPSESIDIGRYDAAFYFEIPPFGPATFDFGTVEYGVSLSHGRVGLDISADGETALEIPLSPMLDGLRSRAVGTERLHEVPGRLLTAEGSGGATSATLLVIEIRWSDSGTESGINQLEAFLLLDVSP